MLQNLGHSYKNGDIVSVKTLQGEEFIAKFLSEEHDVYIFEKPLSLQPNQEGQISFVPSIFSGENKRCIFPKSNRAWITNTHSDGEAAYLSASTGIQTPAKPSIIT